MRRAGKYYELIYSSPIWWIEQRNEDFGTGYITKSGCTRCQESSALLVLFLSQGIYYTDVMLQKILVIDIDYN